MGLNLQNNAPAQRPAPAPSKPAPLPKAPPKPNRGGSSGLGALSPAAPMSGAQIVAAAKALTNTETQGPLAQLAQEISSQNRANANAVKQTAGYFNELGKYVKGDNQQVASAAANLNGRLGTIATGLNQGLNGISTAAQNQTAAYTPAGDADVSAAGQQALISALAQQHGLASQNMGAFKAEGAEQGTTAKQLAAQLGASYIKGGQEDLGTIRAAGQSAIAPLTQKFAADEDTRSADLGKNLTTLRQQEVVNNQNQQKINTDNAALGITKYKAVTGATNTAAAIAERGAAAAAATKERGEAAAAEMAARQAALASKNAAQAWTETYQSGELNLKKAAQNWNQTYQQGELNLKKAAAGQAPKLSPNQNNEMMDMLGKATAYVHEFSPKLSPNQIVQTLTEGGKTKRTNGQKVDVPAIDPTLIQAALEIAHKGTLTPQTARAMRNMGITNPTYNGKPLMVR